MKPAIIVFPLAALLLLVSTRVIALDTIETYDKGAADFEFYAGFNGISNANSAGPFPEYQKNIGTTALIGLGLINRFSGYITVSAECNEYFSKGRGALGLGFFGTPLSTDHVDMDLTFDSSATADGVIAAPGFELNLDLKPDMALLGFYLRGAELLTGRDESVPDDPETTEDEYEEKHTHSFVTQLTAGVYWRVAPNHQLLAEYDMAFANNPAAGENVVSVGAAAIGYNVTLNDTIELVSEVSFDIPQQNESFALGIMLGFVATVP